MHKIDLTNRPVAPLTDEERAAIASYEGPITVCPPCTFTEMGPSYAAEASRQRNARIRQRRLARLAQWLEGSA